LLYSKETILQRVKKIILTGPESTGKTTLAKALSRALDVAWVPEYARQYLLEKNGSYHYDDLRQIAQGQLEMETRFSSKASEFLILDTSMLVLKIWSETKYRKADPYILNRLELEKKAIYILCKPDIPWQADPLRENENDRDDLFEIYKTYLETNNCTFVIVSGSEKNRIKMAKDFIKNTSLD